MPSTWPGFSAAVAPASGYRLRLHDSGPKKKGRDRRTEEIYIVIVDNGRSKIYQDVKRGGPPLCPLRGLPGGLPVWRSRRIRLRLGLLRTHGQVLNPCCWAWGGLRNSTGPPPFAGPARASAARNRSSQPVPYYRSKDVLGDPVSKALTALGGKAVFSRCSAGRRHPWLEPGNPHGPPLYK